MRISHIMYTSHFKHNFKKIPKTIRYLAVQKEKIFRQDCFDTRLKTHKLKGKQEEYWAFSINCYFRIVFEFVENGANFIDVGTHSIYQ